MSAPSFTPGPWRAYRANTNSAGDSALHNGGRFAVSTVHIPNFEQELANARLIAAAPELYEALDALSLVVGLTAFKHEEQRAPLQEAVDAARAALAKARGEA